MPTNRSRTRGSLIPKNKTDFNSLNVYDCSCLLSVYLNIMATTKRCACGTCKNDLRYPNSWVRNVNGDPVKLFHFPGTVRQKERRQRWIRSFHPISAVASKERVS